jgi:hypothetical protein
VNRPNHARPEGLATIKKRLLPQPPLLKKTAYLLIPRTNFLNLTYPRRCGHLFHTIQYLQFILLNNTNQFTRQIIVARWIAQALQTFCPAFVIFIAQTSQF